MFKGVRFLFAIMLCIANMIIYGLKVNMAVTIVGMVNKTSSEVQPSGEDQCPNFSPEIHAGPDHEEGEFTWTTEEQQLVIAMYFAGYLVGMFPCGYFADRFNTKRVLLACVLLNAVLTLLVPMCAPYLLVLYALRFLTGLISAANLPIVNVLVGKWVVFEEKSMWVGIIYAGTSLGTVISIATSGQIMHAFGWRAVYYVHGILPFIWCIVFAIFFADNPETQTLISEEERSLLVNSYGHRSPDSRKGNIPWKAIFSSVPFIALIFTNMFGNFAWYFLLTQMPTFMNRVLKYDIKSNTTITCLPYLLNAIWNPICGKALDYGRRSGWWTQTGARKIAVTLSSLPAIGLMIGIAHIGCNREVTVVLLCLSIVMSGMIFIGHLTNQNDLAPNYAGILMGVTNTPGTISAFFLPWFTGYMTRTGHTFANWQVVFYVTIIAQFFAFLIFTLFGSGEIQPWNEGAGGP